MTKRIIFRKEQDKKPKKRFLGMYELLSLLPLLLIVAGIFAYVQMNKKYAEERKEVLEVLSELQYLIGKKRYDEALKGKPGIYLGLEALSKQSIRDKRLHNLVHLYLAFIYKERKQYEQALACLARMQALEGFMAGRIKCLEGDLYCELGDYDRTLAAYLAASTCSPNKFFTPGYLIKVASIYERQKAYDKAMACYQTIIDEYPTCSEYVYAQKQCARVRCLGRLV